MQNRNSQFVVCFRTVCLLFHILFFLFCFVYSAWASLPWDVNIFVFVLFVVCFFIYTENRTCSTLSVADFRAGFSVCVCGEREPDRQGGGVCLGGDVSHFPLLFFTQLLKSKNRAAAR